jgi:hypothetical protein
MNTDIQQLTIKARTAVYDWYRLLDVHAPIEKLFVCLSPQVELILPEGPLRGTSDFESWYLGRAGDTRFPGVVNLFFDEVHELKYLDVAIIPVAGQAGDQGAPEKWLANVQLVVRWQAHRWKPPAPKSDLLVFDAWQRWQMQSTPNGAWTIQQYIVDRLEPLAGSAAL